MLPQLRIENIVNMACFIEWFVHLVIPHKWVVLCLFMVYMVHPLANNVLLSLYWVFLFNFNFMGYDKWFCLHKILLIYIDIFHYLYHDLSLILIPIIVWCDTSHCVYLGGWLMVPFSPSLTGIACVAVDDVVTMRSATFL